MNLEIDAQSYYQRKIEILSAQLMESVDQAAKFAALVDKLQEQIKQLESDAGHTEGA